MQLHACRQTYTLAHKLTIIWIHSMLIYKQYIIWMRFIRIIVNISVILFSCWCMSKTLRVNLFTFYFHSTVSFLFLQTLLLLYSHSPFYFLFQYLLFIKCYYLKNIYFKNHAYYITNNILFFLISPYMHNYNLLNYGHSIM